MAPMLFEVLPDVLVLIMSQKFAYNLHGDDFAVSEIRLEASLPEFSSSKNLFQLIVY